MPKTSFPYEEYKMLRDEIVRKQNVQYKVLNLGVGGITILLGLGFQYKVDIVFLLLPVIIIANNYLFIAEKIAILHAAKYIKKLESFFYSEQRLDGWENFVFNDRKIYRHFDYVALILFFSLFIISSVKGVLFALREIPSSFSVLYIIGTILYFLILLLLYGYVITMNFKINKSAKENK